MRRTSTAVLEQIALHLWTRAVPFSEHNVLSLSAKGQQVCLDHVTPVCDLQLITALDAPVASAVIEKVDDAAVCNPASCVLTDLK